jgi:hypothetical protein
MDLDTDVYGVGEDDLRAMELEKSTGKDREGIEIDIII